MNIGLDNKLIAQYNELASEYLDKIKINNIKDFELVQKSLSILFKENKIEATHPELNEKIKAIKELIDHPEIYLEDKKNYSQYQTIIKTRVLAKIKEIENMSLEEKQKLIMEQQAEKETTQQNIKIQQQAVKPKLGDKRHSDTEEQLLAEMQDQFIAEGLGDYANHNILSQIIEDLDEDTLQSLPQILTELSSSTNTTIDELLSLPSELLFRIIDSHTQVLKLLKAGASINDFSDLSDDSIILILQHTDNIIPLLKKGIPLQQIAQANESELEHLLQYKDISKHIEQGDSIHNIFQKVYHVDMEKNKGHTITEEQLLAEMQDRFIAEGLADYANHPTLREIIADLDEDTLQNLPQILADLSSSANLDELLSLPSEVLFRIIDSHTQVLKLLKAGVSLKDFSTLSDDSFLLVLQHTDNAIRLLKGFSLQQIAQANESELDYLLQDKDISNYIEQGNSIHDIFQKVYRADMEKRS